jgi:hypothetical protein
MFRIIHVDVPPEELLYALNGSIVGLGVGPILDDTRPDTVRHSHTPACTRVPTKSAHLTTHGLTAFRYYPSLVCVVRMCVRVCVGGDPQLARAQIDSTRALRGTWFVGAIHWMEKGVEIVRSRNDSRAPFICVCSMCAQALSAVSIARLNRFIS